MSLFDLLGPAGTAAGIGLEAFGTMQASNAASQVASLSGQISQEEAAQDAVRRTAMEIGARRSQMEVIRNTQKAKALALATAVNQGGQFGSGYQGGQANITGQATTNLLGINQNLQSGEQMFDITQQMDINKMKLASAQGDEATGKGYASLGSSILGSLTPMKNLTGG